jgi:GTPase SAR1 family protein
LRDQYIRDSHGFILVFSIIDQKSFAALPELMEKILFVKDVYYWPCVIVGAKSDLFDERQVSTEEGQQLAQKYGAKYIECSAKIRINVDAVFTAMMEEILKAVHKPHPVK